MRTNPSLTRLYHLKMNQQANIAWIRADRPISPLLPELIAFQVSDSQNLARSTSLRINALYARIGIPGFLPYGNVSGPTPTNGHSRAPSARRLSRESPAVAQVPTIGREALRASGFPINRRRLGSRSSVLSDLKSREGLS